MNALIALLAAPALVAFDCDPEATYERCFRAHGSLEQAREVDSERARAVDMVIARIGEAADTTESAAAAADGLAAVGHRLRGLPPGSELLPGVESVALPALVETIDWYRAGAPTDARPGRARISAWTFDADSSLPGGLAEGVMWDAGCWLAQVDTAPDACRALFPRAVALAHEVRIAWAIINVADANARDEGAEFNRERLAQWKAYFETTGHQYVWELMLNRWVLERSEVVRRDGFGNELGAREVPKSRWIAFHPEAALILNPDGARGEKLVPAIGVQWAGKVWWSGFGDERVEDLWGVALTSTVVDVAAGKRIGHGVTIHRGRFTVSLTMHGDDVALAFNLPLGERLTATSKQWKSRFEHLTAIEPLD